MSAGVFETGKYIDKTGAVRGIRVQPETKALTIATVANAYPAGAIDTAPRAKVSGSRRSYGVHARKVYVRFTGAVPDGYKPNSIISLPWFVKTTFDALVELSTGTYLGSPIELVGTSEEKIK